MSKHDIRSRDDIKLLVETFYAEVKKDDLIGPIFNKMIADDKWPEHLEKLTDFWETNLFAVIKFKGDPFEAHRRTDKAHDYLIDQKHFGKWLLLWMQTIDNLFIGEKAQKAKDNARKMSIGQYLAMWKSRPKNN